MNNNSGISTWQSIDSLLDALINERIKVKIYERAFLQLHKQVAYYGTAEQAIAQAAACDIGMILDNAEKELKDEC